MNSKYNPIFQQFTFPNGVQIPNRVLMAPMTTWSGQPDSQVSDGEIAHYQRRSPGLGAVVTACGYISEMGKGFAGQFGIHSDDLLPSLKRMATAIQQAGSKAILQIYHGGRMCPPDILPNKQPLSASAIPAEHSGSFVPREMTEDEIFQTIEAFGQATRRAIEAGYDGVEIHGANGYLVQQFFSPHANRRTDRWGGSLEKRLNFPLAVVDKIIKTVNQHARKPFIVGYRLSPEEIENPGITMAETFQLVESLGTRQLDYLHVSVNNFWGGSLRDPEDKKPRAVLIQEKIQQKLPVIAVGSIRTPEEALNVLSTGIPLLALARELLIEPDWVQKIQSGQEQQIRLTLSKKSQQELVLPDGLWQVITNSGNWLPFVD